MLQSHSSSLWFLPLSQRHAALGRPLTSPVTNGHFLPRDKKRPSPPSSSPGIACPRSGSDSSCPLLLLKTHFQTLSFSSALFNFRNSPMRRPPLPKESSLLTDSSRTSASSHPAGASPPPTPPRSPAAQSPSQCLSALGNDPGNYLGNMVLAHSSACSVLLEQALMVLVPLLLLHSPQGGPGALLLPLCSYK